MYYYMEVPSSERATITVMEVHTERTRKGLTTNVEALYSDKSKPCY